MYVCVQNKMILIRTKGEPPKINFVKECYNIKDILPNMNFISSSGATPQALHHVSVASTSCTTTWFLDHYLTVIYFFCGIIFCGFFFYFQYKKISECILC